MEPAATGFGRRFELGLLLPAKQYRTLALLWKGVVVTGLDSCTRGYQGSGLGRT